VSSFFAESDFFSPLAIFFYREQGAIMGHRNAAISNFQTRNVASSSSEILTVFNEH